MKRILTAMAALIMAVTTISGQRLANASIEAQYITDKMAVELGLNSSQRNSILQFNLNYLSGIASYHDINSKRWKTRNAMLKSVLSAAQWRKYRDASYFYRPISWRDGAYVHNVYAKYPPPPRGPHRPEGPMYGKPHPGKGKGHFHKDKRDYRPGRPPFGPHDRRR